MPLLERERQVLTTIVESYIADAAPVGSRTVAKKCGLNLSPASIRNIMSDLTEQGYLEQPHASAGRIPSAQAFRLYINEVMRLRPLPESQKNRITGLLGAAGPELGDILRQASRILSGHSLQVSLVIAPRHADARWKRIEFTLIKPGLVMTVLILQGGMVLDRLLETSPDITSDDLTASANYLNHLFGEMTVSEVRAKLLAELRKAETQFGELYRRALAMAAEAFAPEVARELFVDGTANIVNQPEFSDVGRMAELLRVLENRTKLLELLDKSMDEFKTVFILGEESDLESFREFGSISTPYGPSDHPLGALGVIGPVRMDYARLAPVLNFTARALTRMLDRRF
jgi:heat-inducible transcriptional repressor